MNKELIKKYKAEFDHWLNGGKLQAKFVNEPWEEAPEGIFSFTTVNFVLAIDDYYAEFRRALAEGKIVEYLGYKQEWKNLTENCRKLEGIRLEELRIKPEEPKFKKGDWVINKTSKQRIIKKVTSVYSDSVTVGDSTVGINVMSIVDLELWEPKAGEWCWVFNYLSDVPNLRRVIKVEDNFKNRFDGKNYTKAVRVSRGDDLCDEVGYRFCEPFIGQLPTSIKEYKKG